MMAETTLAWSVFTHIFAGLWDGFTHVYPRYDTRDDDGLVETRLGCGNPETMGYIAYRCLSCGQGTPRVAMRCQSSLYLRCTTVDVDTWVNQVSRMLHEGVLSRHIVRTVPAL